MPRAHGGHRRRRGCGSSDDTSLEGTTARVVDLPGAESAIDFDDIVHSARLRRIIVPARRSGLYLIDPRRRP
jgi:hypothetical protein